MIRYSMQHQTMIGGKKLLWLCLSLFTFSFSMSATAGAPLPGAYCLSQNTRLTIAGELAGSLDLTMRSRTAQINKDSTAAISELASSRAILFLAASHAAAARTILIIDAIIQAKSAEDYAHMLTTWFPLLHASLQTLPNNATIKAAADLIDRAEDYMQGDSEGDPMDLLAQARHMLACDSLDIPIQQALQAQSNLIKQFNKNTKSKAYDDLLNALHNAMGYALKNSNGGIE